MYDPSTALVLLSLSSYGLLVDVSLVIDPDAVLSTVKWGGTLDPNVNCNWIHERQAWVWVMGWLERSEVGRIQCAATSLYILTCRSRTSQYRNSHPTHHHQTLTRRLFLKR